MGRVFTDVRQPQGLVALPYKWIDETVQLITTRDSKITH